MAMTLHKKFFAATAILLTIIAVGSLLTVEGSNGTQEAYNAGLGILFAATLGCLALGVAAWSWRILKPNSEDEAKKISGGSKVLAAFGLVGFVVVFLSGLAQALF